MPISFNNRRRFERFARAAAAAGVAFAANTAGELYRAAVSANKDANTPVGPFKGPSSRAGEYPYQDSTQGSENVAVEHNFRRMRSAFGVKGPKTGTARTVKSRAGGFSRQVPGGMHLIDLVRRGRKGPVHIVNSNRAKIIEAMKRGTRSVKP